MKHTRRLSVFWLAAIGLAGHACLGADASRGIALEPGDAEVAGSMHSAMEQSPCVTVGQGGEEIIGCDNRALQAAVDYIAGLGGGVVKIGPGEYAMRDSLHLRSDVTVLGTKGKTILRKADGPQSPLVVDGDYGEEQVTVANPEGFHVGDGIAIWDTANAGGFTMTVARITGRSGNTFSISQPLNDDCLMRRGAMAALAFPVVSGSGIEGARVENIIVEGNKDHNPYLSGCRGGGIYLFRGYRTVIANCTVKNYNGDGVSFQASNDVELADCLSEGNANMGFHPGAGSQRAHVTGCVARDNGNDGLYLCWRVRHGVFENNMLEDNGRYGATLGHKDSDNLLRNNHIRANYEGGVAFRDTGAGLAMAPSRNTLENNLIENNGTEHDVAGISVSGKTTGLIFRDNTIQDTRPPGQRKQTIGVRVDDKAGDVALENNRIDAARAVVMGP